MFNQLWSHGPLYAYNYYVLGSLRTDTYTCTDGCLFVHEWVLINSGGWVLKHAWMGAYVCMDGYLYMNGRVLVHAWTGVLSYSSKFS